MNKDSVRLTTTRDVSGLKYEQMMKDLVFSIEGMYYLEIWKLVECQLDIGFVWTSEGNHKQEKAENDWA